MLVAGRELLASKGLFIKKKKYAVLNYDVDVNSQDYKDMTPLHLSIYLKFNEISKVLLEKKGLLVDYCLGDKDGNFLIINFF